MLCGKNMPGMQGHPEFSVDFEHRLILANASYLESDQVKMGIESLRHPVHSEEVASWMTRFLLRNQKLMSLRESLGGDMGPGKQPNGFIEKNLA